MRGDWRVEILPDSVPPNRPNRPNSAEQSSANKLFDLILSRRELFLGLWFFFILFIVIFSQLGSDSLPTFLALGPTATPTITLTPSQTVLPAATPAATSTTTPRATETATITWTPAPNATSTRMPILTPTPIVEISERDDMVQVFVPEGKFLMGSLEGEPDADLDEQPQRLVYLDAFWIDQTEVTNAQFRRFIVATGYRTDAQQINESPVYNLDIDEWEETTGAYWQQPRGLGSSLDGLNSYPVVQVSWNDAVAYCKWAERRLPTEAEWEKAARGVDGRRYPWGSTPLESHLLNSADRAIAKEWASDRLDDGYRFAAPVGNYPDGASPYGALDMAGNVWEWVYDIYYENIYRESPNENPTGATYGNYRVRRGGSWRNTQKLMRVTHRLWHSDWSRSDQVGFRCAMSVVEEEEEEG